MDTAHDCRPLPTADLDGLCEQDAPTLPSIDLSVFKHWVLSTFDQAVWGARQVPERLQRMYEHTCVQAQLLGENALARVSTDPTTHDRHQRQQVQRLCQLAPAALQWLERHRGALSAPDCDEFRLHLAHRCERIMRERPHREFNEE